MTSPRELLRRLAAHDEAYVRAVLAPHSPVGEAVLHPPALGRTARALVELAALLASDAATPSLRCAVDRAATTGADDHVLVHVLETAASATGAAQTVKSACRLALALDVDTEQPPLAKQAGLDRARHGLRT